MMTNFAVVLPAGGLGTRMGAKVPKQLLKINGKAVYRYSLETFLSIPEISEVVLAVPFEWKSHFENELFETHGTNSLDRSLLKKLKITVGGKERFESVRNGIEILSTNAQFVLVHDVARPFITKELIYKIFNTLNTKGSCIVAKPSADTVKVIKDGCVERTLDRTTIWLAQTPQACSISLLKSLYKKMDENPLGFVPTDEASILEHFGVPIYIIEGNAQNDKLTTPEDFQKAAGSLFNRESFV